LSSPEPVTVDAGTPEQAYVPLIMVDCAIKPDIPPTCPSHDLPVKVTPLFIVATSYSGITRTCA
jgi:hypothetical protein